MVKRKYKGIGAGKSLSEMTTEERKAYNAWRYIGRSTRGKHPQEEKKYGKTLPKRKGVGKIPKPIQKKPKKSAWNTAYYSSPLKRAKKERVYHNMSSYDYMKTSFEQYRKKRQKGLFAMHQYFQEWVEMWQNLYAEPQAFDELKFEYESEPGDEMNEEPQKIDTIRLDRIRFEWVLYNLQDEPQVLYFLQYQKGQIRRAKLPESFDRVLFVTTIKSWGLWE